METYNDEATSRLISEITPEEQAKTNAKMQLAAKIADAMLAKGWNKTRLMKALGKSNPSEITRWLSGTQNFTVDTLVDLERVLDIKFLNLGETKSAEMMIKQFNVDIIVPFNQNEYSARGYLSEPNVADTYYKKTFYA